MEHWQEIENKLRQFAPPLPSMLTKPDIRIMVDADGQIHGRDNHIAEFSQIQKLPYPYSKAPFTTWRMTSSDFFRRPTPAMGWGNAVLIDREYWRSHCTKMVLVTDFIPDLDPTVLTPLVDIASVKLPLVEETQIGSIDYENQPFICFQKPSSEIKIVRNYQGNLTLGLSNFTLIGINQYQAQSHYYDSWYDNKPIKTEDVAKGPVLLSSSDQLETVTLIGALTENKLVDIDNQIISRTNETQWFGRTQAEPPPQFDGPAAAAKYERKINYQTKWAGKISPTEFVRLLSEGYIVDPPTIATLCIDLLRHQQLALKPEYTQKYIVVEEKSTPLGNIFVLPTLSLEHNLAGNSMKLPSSHQRMDVSFTLLQTNPDLISKRTSNGQLKQIQISTLIDLLASSTDNLPFDLDTLAHIFSALTTSGALGTV